MSAEGWDYITHLEHLSHTAPTAAERRAAHQELLSRQIYGTRLDQARRQQEHDEWIRQVRQQTG